MSPRNKAPRFEEGAAQENQLRAARLSVALFFGIGLVVFFGVFGGLRIYSIVAGESGPPRAAIVDQLSLTFPNQDFIEEATMTLERAGYVVDYYPGEEITVDFYRDLPEQNHDLVIFRAHAARGVNAQAGAVTALFTSEPYDQMKHVDEQRALRVGIAGYDENDLEAEDGESYFGIMPGFIASGMSGDFDGALVVLMGCEVLTSTELAQAFIDSGAEAVVGWDDTVSASHTDAATLNMLEHLVLEDLSLREAAAVAMVEVGPDPFYDSVLVSYPPEG